jgi:hypothetical protein
MRAMLCAVLMALATTTAGAAENLNSANYWLPRCKEFIAANSNWDLDGQEVCAERVEALSLASCLRTQTTSPRHRRFGSLFDTSRSDHRGCTSRSTCWLSKLCMTRGPASQSALRRANDRLEREARRDSWSRMTYAKSE